MAETAIIVPCRLESTRFPRKLLHPIRGKPLLRWVAERIAREAPEFPLWFAVDHDLLRECVEAAGFRALMTSGAHQSGTDRIAEANRTVRADFVINVQADEPLVSGCAPLRRTPKEDRQSRVWAAQHAWNAGGIPNRHSNCRPCSPLIRKFHTVRDPSALPHPCYYVQGNYCPGTRRPGAERDSTWPRATRLLSRT